MRETLGAGWHRGQRANWFTFHLQLAGDAAGEASGWIHATPSEFVSRKDLLMIGSKGGEKITWRHRKLWLSIWIELQRQCSFRNSVHANFFSERHTIENYWHTRDCLFQWCSSGHFSNKSKTNINQITPDGVCGSRSQKNVLSIQGSVFRINYLN